MLDTSQFRWLDEQLKVLLNQNHPTWSPRQPEMSWKIHLSNTVFENLPKKSKKCIRLEWDIFWRVSNTPKCPLTLLILPLFLWHNSPLFTLPFSSFPLYFDRFSILGFGMNLALRKVARDVSSQTQQGKQVYWSEKQKIALPQEQSPLYGPFLVPKPLARRKWENRHFLRLAFWSPRQAISKREGEI